MAYRHRLVAVMDNGDKHTIGVFDSYDEARESLDGYIGVMNNGPVFIGGNGGIVNTGHLVSLGIVIDLDKVDLMKKIGAIE